MIRLSFLIVSIIAFVSCYVINLPGHSINGYNNLLREVEMEVKDLPSEIVVVEEVAQEDNAQLKLTEENAELVTNFLMKYCSKHPKCDMTILLKELEKSLSDI